MISQVSVCSVLLLTLVCTTQITVCAKHSTKNNDPASGGTKSEKYESASASKKSTSKNILFVAPFGSKSHKVFYDGIIEAIADGGHKVTVLTPFKATQKHVNIKSVVYENNDMDAVMTPTDADEVMTATMRAMEDGPSYCFIALSAQKTKSVLLKKFDLIFVSAFYGECFLRAVHSMDAPIVFVNPLEIHGPFSALRMGNPSFPSLSYDPLLKFQPPLTMYQRFFATMYGIGLDLMITFSFKRIDATGENTKLFSSDSPTTEAISANASLYIANSVRLADSPRPSIPNILLAGSIQCRPAQPLPDDLRQWVEGAGDAGLIYFSLGSAVNPSDLSNEILTVLMTVFVSLPQHVLWVHDQADRLRSEKENVRLMKWAPQQDLLGHPRTRLFISHGGLLSTQEAAYHGVPVLGLPLAGDQEGNIAAAELGGWGRRLSLKNLTAEEFTATIQDILEDKKYQTSARQRGALLRDVPLSPSREVLWWTEYLLRTAGAPHLRSPARYLSWYQLYNVDVWLSVATVALLLLWLQYRLLRAILLRCCCRRNKSSNKTSDKLKKN